MSEGKEEELKVEIDAESPMAAGDESPAKNAGLIAQFLAIFKKFSVGQDLTAQPMAVPEGFEGKDTGLERMQAAALRHSDILIKANEIDDPVLRLIEIVKWNFTMGQMFTMKKPLNPTLGEVSICKFYSKQPKEGNKNDGKCKKEKEEEKDLFYGLSEMVSHHPPISAYVIENKERGIRLEGWSKTNIKFMGTSVKVNFEGTSTIALEKFHEVYTYHPPPVQVRLIGFVLEFCGKKEISCSSHPYVARITYKEKPALRGKYHRLKGTIVKVNESGKDEEVVVKFKGHWNQEVKFEDLRNKQTYTFLSGDYPQNLGSPIYPPFEDELPESSRKIWQGVKNAPDSTTSAKAKKEVEEEQRRKAKEREEKKEEHKPKFFIVEGNGWKAKDDILKSIAF